MQGFPFSGSIWILPISYPALEFVHCGSAGVWWDKFSDGCVTWWEGRARATAEMSAVEQESNLWATKDTYADRECKQGKGHTKKEKQICLRQLIWLHECASCTDKLVGAVFTCINDMAVGGGILLWGQLQKEENVHLLLFQLQKLLRKHTKRIRFPLEKEQLCDAWTSKEAIGKMHSFCAATKRLHAGAWITDWHREKTSAACLSSARAMGADLLQCMKATAGCHLACSHVIWKKETNPF